MGNKDGIAKNIEVIVQQWKDCFDEMHRNLQRFVRMFYGTEEVRPLHYLWGIWTAFIGIPYRTWAFVVLFYIIFQATKDAGQL